MPIEVPPTPERVLAVAAHPDDLEFMAGGTMARWAADGARITYCIVTDGASGSRDPSMSSERLIVLRQEEQRTAAAVIGVEEVIFLGYPDGRLEPTLELRFNIARVIRRVRPDVLITGDPTMRWSATFGYINHPDHIAAGEATLAAVMPTANTLLAAPELLAEGLEPHDVSEVLLSSWGTGNLYVPLSEEDLARKARALQAHVSQLGGRDMLPMMREWGGRTAEAAREQGLDCTYAEGFVRIVLRQPQLELPEPSPDAPDTTTT
jgi:LmbE family N-acetylglucosaminyl deacetylase